MHRAFGCVVERGFYRRRILSKECGVVSFFLHCFIFGKEPSSIFGKEWISEKYSCFYVSLWQGLLRVITKSANIFVFSLKSVWMRSVLVFMFFVNCRFLICSFQQGAFLFFTCAYVCLRKRTKSFILHSNEKSNTKIINKYTYIKI